MAKCRECKVLLHDKLSSVFIRADKRLSGNTVVAEKARTENIQT